MTSSTTDHPPHVGDVVDLSGELADERRFLNTFPDFADLSAHQIRDVSAHIHERVDAAIPPLIREISSKIGPIAEASDSRFNIPDFTLYAGVGGLALALRDAHGYLQHVQGKAELTAACEADCGRAVACALELIENDRASDLGFHCGTPGIHALAATIRAERDPSAAIEHTRHVLGMLEAALRTPEAELLFGRAGYLYSLLVLRRHTPSASRPPELDGAMDAMFDGLLSDGAALGRALSLRSHPTSLVQSPLAFGFPAKEGHVYLGAAHGLAGVLYVLMHLGERCLRPGTRELITGALDYIVSVQTEDGNFPVGPPMGDARPAADLVHWCHGAPGIIPTLCKAYEVFGEESYLRAALRAADCVWSRGLLRKGLGVCHGIAGSMLSLLHVHRTTGSQRYLYRALRMCEATWSASCLEAIAQFDDPKRYRPGVPDLPNSLMEGKAGLLYAYVSIQRPATARFPGYDTEP